MKCTNNKFLIDFQIKKNIVLTNQKVTVPLESYICCMRNLIKTEEMFIKKENIIKNMSLITIVNWLFYIKVCSYA